MSDIELEKSNYEYNCALQYEKRREAHKRKYQKYKNNPRRILSSIYNGAKRRARKRGFGFNITKEYIQELYIKQQGRCAITDVKMSFIANDKYKISLDRINSKKGYLKNNVQLLCWWVNRCKSNYSRDDLVIFAKGVLRSMGE